MMCISSELEKSLINYDSFLPWIESYAMWSRTQSGVPANYKCLLFKLDSDVNERELKHALPILSEIDARIIDKACAYISHHSYEQHKLFEILVISGWDCVDAFYGIPLVRKIFRHNHERFNIPMLEAKKRDLIERVRATLILYLDNHHLFDIQK